MRPFLKNKIIILGSIFYSVVALSQDIGSEVHVQIKDVFEAISLLIKNSKGLSGIGIASAIVVILIQLLKTEMLGNLMNKLPPFWKRILIVLLGQISGILIGVNSGMGWVNSIIAGLLTSGGAIAIYECLKPLFVKKS